MPFWHIRLASRKPVMSAPGYLVGKEPGSWSLYCWLHLIQWLQHVPGTLARKLALQEHYSLWGSVRFWKSDENLLPWLKKTTRKAHISLSILPTLLTGDILSLLRVLMIILLGKPRRKRWQWPFSIRKCIYFIKSKRKTLTFWIKVKKNLIKIRHWY